MPTGRILATTLLAFTVVLLAPVDVVQAAQRTFIVMLANSPKEFPGPDRAEPGQPTGGLTPSAVIQERYFDVLSDDVGSFAEYWQEISYGDVTISGRVTGWINLPWAIRPPLEDIADDDPDGDDDDAPRISPDQFVDLNKSSNYEYGAGELVLNQFAAVRIDTDGDPDNVDNGPFAPGLGGLEFTPTGSPIYRPGERFADMDGDGRWDGLDESRNQMDWNRDGRPDLRGPWFDLSVNNDPDTSDDCIYLQDSDNDFNPDCCPDGPGTASCMGFPFDTREVNNQLISTACPATVWTGPNDTEITDCNGNLIDDAVDIASGRSLDRLPWEGNDDSCFPGDGDGVPDECQFAFELTDDAFIALLFDSRAGCVAVGGTDEVPAACINANVDRCPAEIDPELPQRCEFDDADRDGALDVVEPFENFLRRWDPCMLDPDVHSDNTIADAAHWIKVYDPSSFSAPGCSAPADSFAYDASTQPEFVCPVYAPDCNLDSPSDPFRIVNPLHRTGARHVPSYIQNNYPGDYVALEQAAGARQLWGAHDPFGKITGPCICADGLPCEPKQLGPDPRPVVEGGDSIAGACRAGTHAQYDPPDRWANVIVGDEEGEETPGGQIISNSKMQQAPGDGPFTAKRIFEQTPRESWYEQAWTDRYVGGPDHPLASDPRFAGCKNPNFDPEDAQSEPFVKCEAPDWPSDNRTHLVRPFQDDNPDVYDPDIHRRFFKANRGGLNGNGTGWFGCGGNLERSILFETGDLVINGDPISFAVSCNAAILPDELVEGEDQVGQYYDGWVEHDDLPSSKYHKEGDQRLGEVTSPNVAWVSRGDGEDLGDSLNPDFGNFDQPRIPAIWGEDRGRHNPNAPPVLDGIIPAAGPYAQHIHGNFGRDAGNQLTIELLTWRREPPFNNGTVWESQHGRHPFAGPSGLNMGFRDYNLDGLIDLGEVRPAGSENYIEDSIIGTSDDGTASRYPFNRRRLLEDCVEVLDFSNDFDDFVDEGAMFAAGGCSGAPFSVSNFNFIARFPIEFVTARLLGVPFGSVSASGIASGIVLLPPGAEGGQQLFPLSPGFYPIHTEDGLGDPDYVSANLPRTGNAQLSWHLFFHDLVKVMLPDEEGLAAEPFETDYTAYGYLHAWEGFPDLYDYDVLAGDPGVDINCPVAGWDIMANGGLVHPNPSLKESACTEWLSSVDLKTVLTPGVESTITLPPMEFVRDNSVFYLENENRPGERLWLWSAGSGFDRPGHPGTGGFPGQGVLIMHTDFEANDEGIPPQQNTPPFRYVIIQADGLNELEDGTTLALDDRTSQVGQGSCQTVADAGDPWPGSTNTTVFNCDTVPPSRWNTQNSCSGLEVTNVVLDGSGGARVSLRWTPTSIPSLQFVNPPGGVSVPVSPTNVRYRIKYKATDVYGGTTITLYYAAVPDPVAALKAGTAVQIGTPLKKTQPGTADLTRDWNIKPGGIPLPDGQYFLFARLTPGLGADGTEIAFTTPRAGRNNIGQGTVTVNSVGAFARTETWTLELIDLTQTNQCWMVNGSLTQKLPDNADSIVSCNDIPAAQRFLVNRATGTGEYTPSGGEVTFTLQTTGTPFAIGDRWSFVTTGVTAASQPLTIDDGQIKEGPTAVIFASPLSGLPPLTVSFDGRASTDSNSGTLRYVWNFGDGGPTATGATQVHTFTQPRTHTVVLTVTNLSTGLSTQASVDIEVTNNSPTARIQAAPTSGPAPLTVTFDASSSSDAESPLNELVFQWDFDDGTTGNPQGAPGVSIQPTKFYTRRISGTLSNGTPCTLQSPCTCTSAEPCNFTAKLTVTDPGGKSDVDTIDIQVGNSRPVANITHSALQGPAPWTVTFNAITSSDPDEDTITVDWVWGDGQQDLGLKLTGPNNRTDGQVEHTYATSGQYQPVVTLRDGRGGVTVWSQATVVVSDAGVGSSDPRAIFVLDPEEPVLNEPFTADATLSFDRPSGLPSSYSWNWGDGSPMGTGVIATHTYTEPGRYTITLTVADAESPPNTNAISKMVTITGEGGPPEPPPQNQPPTARFVISGGPEVPNEGIAGQTVFTFDASASSDPEGGSLTYAWSFGDGRFLPDGDAVVTHTYATAGTFVARLTVRDDANGAMDTTQTVIVREDQANRAPFAIITQGQRIGEVPLTLRFDASLSYDPDNDPLTYTWDFGDNTALGSGPTVTHTYTEEGDYTVTLDVFDGIAVGSAEPETVRVLASSVPTEPEPEQPEPPTGGGSGSRGICGLGMMLGLFGSLFGLSAMRLGRRRLH